MTVGNARDGVNLGEEDDASLPAWPMALATMGMSECLIGNAG